MMSTITPDVIAAHQLTESEYDKILEPAGPRTHLNRTRHFQRDVERALLLQEFAHSSEEASHRKQTRSARPGRKRRDHRYRRRLCDRVQDRIPQPSQLYRAVSGRSYRRRRHSAGHFHYGRAAYRGSGCAALRAFGRSQNRRPQPPHPGRRRLRHLALRELFRCADDRR